MLWNELKLFWLTNLLRSIKAYLAFANVATVAAKMPLHTYMYGKLRLGQKLSFSILREGLLKHNIHTKWKHIYIMYTYEYVYNKETLVER